MFKSVVTPLGIGVSELSTTPVNNFANSDILLHSIYVHRKKETKKQKKKQETNAF